MESEWKDLGTYEGLSGFQGAVGKFIRARHQLRQLNERFRVFAQGNPYGVVEEFNLRPGKEIGEYAYLIDWVSVPKREWGILIGEVVHNLRSALDHAVYAAASDPSNETQFPIFNSRKNWAKRSCAMLYSVPENVVGLIEEAQPYHAPEPASHVLAILRTLSNHDKHRLLHTAALTVEGAAPGFGPAHDIAEFHSYDFPGMGKPLKPGLKLARAFVKPDGPNPKMQMYGEFILGIAFCDPKTGEALFGGYYVGEILLRALKVIEKLVVRMELACSEPQPPIQEGASPSKG